ncbi:MAG: hypothetical protein II922_12690 [Succinimonas sp.]|nr:hypothetical protein [Succinimonas sp.]
MTALNSIRNIYDTAKWSYSDDEFSITNASQEHSVLLDNDLEIVFRPLSRDEFLVYANIFELSESDPEDNDLRLRHLSKLVLKINSEYSVTSAIKDGKFRFEMYINTTQLSDDQICFLLQMFMNDCDLLISENSNQTGAMGSMFNNIPIGFLMN